MPAREPFVIAVIDDDPNVRELLAVIGKRAGGVVGFGLVGSSGLEPLTSTVSRWRSNQLS